MFLMDRKLEARVQELAQYRYRDGIEILAFLTTEDEGLVGTYPPEVKGDSKLQQGDQWTGRDRYLWLHAAVQIPAQWKDQKVVGLFDFGRTGGGNNSGFESLLFLNGKPFQGVDSNHQEVFFPPATVGSTVQLDFRLWSGLEGGGEPREQTYTLETSRLCWLDEAVDDLYYTSLAAWQTIKELGDERPEKHEIIKALNQAFMELDWSKPGDDNFYDSCKIAGTILHEMLNEIEKHHPVTIHCVGHTHIDVAWLWQLKHTREKAARSFSTVLRLMEQYPEYYFLQTQPQLYEYIKHDYPEIYENIKKRVKEGRWESEGGMWLEADCNIPSGESLVRQILYGKAFFKREFEIDCQYLWLPDVFGYSWALPQILKKSGIDTFMTTKISWNQYNRMPHDTFKWRGIDGTEIVTHFITTPEPWNSPDSWFYTYNGLITAKTVNGAWNSYRNKDINQDLLLSYGYGDGGGGVNREMIELRRRFENMPGLPQVKTTTAGDFFKKLHENIEKTNEYVHTWDGELYLEYHRGTYTSQAYTKRMNRKLELGYRESEWLSVWNSLRSSWGKYPQQNLDEGWKIILRNQFHDIIPGSSIKEVYEDARVEYEQAEEIHHEIVKENLKDLIEPKSNTYTVFNAANWEDQQSLIIPYDNENNSTGKWSTMQGQILNSQQTEQGWLIEIEKLSSFGVVEIQFEKQQTSYSEIPFTYHEKSLETPYYLIEWNDALQITRLYDKEAKREVLNNQNKGNILQMFEDKPLAHDAWDIDLYYQEKMEEVNDVLSSEIVEKGTLQTVIRTKWQYGRSIIEQDMVLYAHNRRIDFKTRVDWHEQRKLLKVAFPVDIRTTEATYDIQFGNVKRPTHWNTSWDMARFETVGHQWADLSETGYGVSVLNDCKYGYDIKDQTIRLSLLKAAIYPDPTADQGEHVFTYSLLPHIGDWRTGDTVKQAWYVNNPLKAVKGSFIPKDTSFMKVHNEHVKVDAIKKKEDENAVIIRLHEYEGRRGQVSIEFPEKVKSWSETNLLEQLEGSIQTGELTFEINPYEIKTLLIHFS
ncbi:alpha-mannosidase [Fredinandcohnia quinoae]|uniref:Alpha-mannosidase n=1 Tax=Fredinandcohnia quinoae TaxID=2918902 RepID=A0AAW5DX35_9BACI|nr:alpha-mannosidase [Fredinandcohnia sp. SECRCQ15]MCH1625217.1 alpha-mannosidase [Fredinandcohnia sp. SECRCQ15]